MANSIDNSYLNQYTTKDYSKLFGSLPKTSESSGGSLVGLATEFSSIRSGSYGKLLSAYYKKMSNTGAEEAVQKETKNRQLVGGNASALKSAAKTLSKMDFAKASDEESLKAAKDFVSAYNAVIDTADDVNSKSILRNAVWMTNIMEKSAGMLGELGISIGENNQLTLDEAKWTAASKTTKASLFNGRQGLAEKMIYKASQMTNASAEKAAFKASAYKPDGTYTQITPESMFEDIM